MVPLSDARRIVRELILEQAKYRPSVGDIQVETIFDESNDHYEMICSGWANGHRIHGCVLHLDLRGDKVWIQYDGTHDGIANDLVAAGIPREQIVLAFKPPSARPHTGYATV